MPLSLVRQSCGSNAYLNSLVLPDHVLCIAEGWLRCYGMLCSYVNASHTLADRRGCKIGDGITLRGLERRTPLRSFVHIGSAART